MLCSHPDWFPLVFRCPAQKSQSPHHYRPPADFLSGSRGRHAPLFSLPSHNQAWHAGFRCRFEGWALTVPPPWLYCLLSASIPGDEASSSQLCPPPPRLQTSVMRIFLLGSEGQDTCLSLQGITSGKDKSTAWLSLSGWVETCSLLQVGPCSPTPKFPKAF